MKRLEDLRHGDTFTLNENLYILTSDYRIRKNYEVYCVNLKTGFSTWVQASDFVTPEPIYTLDTDNNIVPAKETKKENT